MMKVHILHLLLILCIPFLGFSLQTDTINSTLSLTDSDTITSPGSIFKLGFFTPNNNNSTNRYLGIFFNVSEQTVIWVANRHTPLQDSSGIVTITRDGNLVLTNGRTNEIIWSTNIINSSTLMRQRNTSAQLQDTGNLVVRDMATGDILWDAFSHPSNTFMPTMRITDDTNTNDKVILSSWRNEIDPALGNFTAGLEAMDIPQIYTWNNGRPYWRSGPWNGQILIGVQDMYSSYFDGFSVVNDQRGSFYCTAPEGAFLMRIALNSTGSMVQMVWNNQSRNWDATWLAPQHECDVYGTCGPFGSCNSGDSPMCSCLRGFEPANREEWDRGNWTSGCVRRTQLQCGRGNSSSGGGNGDGFLRLQFMKVPDFAEQFRSGGLDDCRIRCLGNCSCIAYAHDLTIGCMFWSGSLIDVQRFSGVGLDLYLRLASSELGEHQNRRLVIIIPIVVGVAVICVAIFIVGCWMVKRKGKKTKGTKVFEIDRTLWSDPTGILLKDDTKKVNIDELPLFTFETLANATEQFNEKNLLGKGGFGPVYKGILANGKEVAMKRLSAASGQGNEEFMNEVVVISKLQHRNLVRLLGCCVEGEEKMLIYEYMPNKSLDGCLFDPNHPSHKILDWRNRFSIIGGIGRGLLYLHRDSRLKIIHRDLKPSNVLLDEDWNPKISDFGMARIFGGNEDHGNTVRVVGTYGYMAPEYAMEGRFSEKSDVYSFGVLMLEILSGKKNTHYYNEEWSLSLLGCAWKLWNDNNGLAFVYQNVENSNLQGDIVRCIHIALLCVQEFPNERPLIQNVLAMLSREILELPQPEQPVFAEKWNRSQLGIGMSTHPTGRVGDSVNELTLTVLDGR